MGSNLDKGLMKNLSSVSRGVIGKVANGAAAGSKRQPSYIFNDPKTGRVFSSGNNSAKAPAMKNAAQGRAAAIARKAGR